MTLLQSLSVWIVSLTLGGAVLAVLYLFGLDRPAARYIQDHPQFVLAVLVVLFFGSLSSMVLYERLLRARSRTLEPEELPQAPAPAPLPLRADRLAQQDVHLLTPTQFREFIGELFAAFPGWTVFLSPPSGDPGADVIATSPYGVIYAIRTLKVAPDARIDVPETQRVIASKPHYNASEALLISSGQGYTSGAEVEAQRHRLQLWSAQEVRDAQLALARGVAMPPGI